MTIPTNMPIAPSATVRHVEAFKRCPPFDTNATVRVLSTHNPWRPNAFGRNFFEAAIRGKGTTTVEQIYRDAEAIGYFRTDVARLLRWLYTWGDFVEIDGKRHFPEHVIPTAPLVAPKKKRAKK